MKRIIKWNKIIYSVLKEILKLLKILISKDS